jgi:hypothetical protein
MVKAQLLRGRGRRVPGSVESGRQYAKPCSFIGVGRPGINRPRAMGRTGRFPYMMSGWAEQPASTGTLFGGDCRIEKAAGSREEGRFFLGQLHHSTIYCKRQTNHVYTW